MKAERPPLKRRCVFLEDAIWERLGERARVDDVSIGTLVRELLNEGIEARNAGGGGVGKTRAVALQALLEDVAEGVKDHAALIGAVGRTAIGLQQLLVHWAAREGGLDDDEDELLAEVTAVGVEGWQQVLDELAAGATKARVEG